MFKEGNRIRVKEKVIHPAFEYLIGHIGVVGNTTIHFEKTGDTFYRIDFEDGETNVLHESDIELLKKGKQLELFV